MKSMWRVFLPSQNIEFKYLMLNKATGKYQFCNFTNNFIEPEQFDSEIEAEEHLELLKTMTVISNYQQV